MVEWIAITLGRLGPIEVMTPAERSARRQAILEFARRCTIPIAATDVDSGQRSVVGSGLLYRANGRSFLVTATHVAEFFQDERLEAGIPGGVAAAGPIQRAQLPIHKGDVAIMELSERFVAILEGSGRWHFLEGSEDADRPHYPESEFVLVGYPSRLSEITAVSEAPIAMQQRLDILHQNLHRDVKRVKEDVKACQRTGRSTAGTPLRS